MIVVSDFLKLMMVMQGMGNNQPNPPKRRTNLRDTELRAILDHLETLRMIIVEQQRSIRSLRQELSQLRRLSAQTQSGRTEKLIGQYADTLNELNQLQQNRSNRKPNRKANLNRTMKQLRNKILPA